MQALPEDVSENFVKIGEGIYLSLGQASDSQVEDPQTPTVILIFGWMAAKLPHLYKYSQVYHELYPKATQVIVRSEPSFFWSTQSTRYATLEPVVEALEALGCITPTPKYNHSIGEHSSSEKFMNGTINTTLPRVLVHAFSNGGSYQMVTLGKMLAERQASLGKQSVQLTTAIILDSAPGNGGYAKTVRAFTASIPSRILRFFAAIFIGVLYYYFFILKIVFGKRDYASILRDALYNPHLLPWMNERSPRLYIFSKKDEMIAWEQVQAHVEESKAKGLTVQKEMFQDTPHVAHARADPARYWAAVGRVWKQAC